MKLGMLACRCCFLLRLCAIRGKYQTMPDPMYSSCVKYADSIVCVFCVRCSMLMDEVLFSIADDVKNFGVIYLVDITEVSDFSSMCAIHSLFDLVCASFRCILTESVVFKPSSKSVSSVSRSSRYELYDPCTVMFFFRNKHIMIDLGTGNNNKSTSCGGANVLI